ncbi:MAG: hypothetical protein N2C14_23490 [Planctomycetales bacterium]
MSNQETRVKSQADWNRSVLGVMCEDDDEELEDDQPVRSQRSAFGVRVARKSDRRTSQRRF